jgi:hypothetical protein
MQDGSTEETDKNGISAPLCTPACLGKHCGCVHEQKKVQINTLGQYILFPSKWYHQGYYNDRSGMVFVTAQLFARPSISPDSKISLRTIHSKDQMIEGWLGDEASQCWELIYWSTGTQHIPFSIFNHARIFMDQWIWSAIVKFPVLSLNKYP